MLITIAVPTISGRHKYLDACLRTCTAQDFDNIEIIVSDNSSGDAEDYVRSLKDSRIRYIRPKSYLPMSAHWDFVLGHVSGDMMTFIGDDDGLMPGCINSLLDLLTEFKNTPIHHSLPNYYWGDFPQTKKQKTISCYHDAAPTIQYIESTNFLDSICAAKCRYVDGPMIYHNFIPVELVRNLTISGRFFRRASPDVYSSVAIAAHIDGYITTGEFLTISGQGARANGASVKLGGSDGQKFLQEMVNNDFIPRYQSRTIQLHLLDSLLEVADTYARNDILKQIDFSQYFATAIVEGMKLHSFATARDEIMSILNQIGHQNTFRSVLRRFLQLIARMVFEKISDSRSIHRDLIRHNTSYISRGEIIATDAMDVYEASLLLDRIVHERSKRQ